MGTARASTGDGDDRQWLLSLARLRIYGSLRATRSATPLAVVMGRISAWPASSRRPTGLEQDKPFRSHPLGVFLSSSNMSADFSPNVHDEDRDGIAATNAPSTSGRAAARCSPSGRSPVAC